MKPMSLYLSFSVTSQKFQRLRLSQKMQSNIYRFEVCSNTLTNYNVKSAQKSDWKLAKFGFWSLRI